MRRYSCKDTSPWLAATKKKKKPAPNPERGFATTSIPKSKPENIKEATSAETSDVATPETTSTPAGEEDSTPQSQALERKLHELSPEELEAQLEASALQTFVETHASKVKKDVSRQVSRLQTERRVLRGQADFLSIKQWLPEELMQQVLDLSLSSFDQQDHPRKTDGLPLGDDLVTKVWNLRLVLLELDVSLVRVDEVIAHILQNPPAEDPASHAWGLPEAFDWIALNCSPHELLEYDEQKKRVVLDSDDDLDEIPGDRSENNRVENARKCDPPFSQAANTSDHAHVSDDFDVSDLESDLEPDELVSLYLRTKTSLYEIDPTLSDLAKKNKSTKSTESSSTRAAAGTSAVRKLQQKLRKIQSDILFDQREADAEWSLRKITLAHNIAQRKQLDLSEINHSPAPIPSISFSGDEVEDAEDGDLLSGMFESLPGVSDSHGNEGTQNERSVTIRYFGNVIGVTPRRILEETCRSRDSRCRIVYKQISPTTYSCRHSVEIDWAKEQEFADSPYMKSVLVKSKPRQLSVSMIREAAPDTGQSESYVATAALFLVFSGSPKEERSHLRLPPTYRDLWHEFSKLKREYMDAADIETIKELRSMIENHARADTIQDNEVVFNASSRRLNGVANGTSTPSSRSHTPAPDETNISQGVKDTWSRKVSMPSYQRMLIPRMNLPVFQSKDIVLEAIEKNQVTIVVGDTGSGKSTQVPQFILGHELSQGRKCKIYCTQPRRISAISLAQRVSQELGENMNDLGTSRSLVGYAIRLESHAVSQTRLVYATVGIVLRMLESASGLDEISHLILDEVHERNIDTDFLLIVLQSLMLKRPDLRIVLMSATVDAQKFSRYLHGAPIISVPGE